MQPLFAHNTTKKAKNKTQKKPQTKYHLGTYVFKNIVEKICTKRLHKHAQSVHTHSETNLVSGVKDEKSPESNF